MFPFDLSSRVGSPISVHSLVFPWIVEHSTDILNKSKCHVAGDGKCAYERLKRRQHRGVLLPFGAAVMFRVAHDGKVARGHVAGKTFSHKRTYCGLKGRWPCDQIKGSEGDA